MTTKNASSFFESKTLKKAVSDAVKGTTYHLKGTNVTKTANVTTAKKVITLKK